MQLQNEKYDIVIIEDSPNDAELIVRTLKKNKITEKLIVLEDGEQALNYFLCQGEFQKRDINVFPKVIFLDIKLPKVTGLDVLKQLKSNDQTRKIPVVMVTSSRQDPDVASAYNLGANSYVVKPVDFKRFKETINQLCIYWLNTNESL